MHNCGNANISNYRHIQFKYRAFSVIVLHSVDTSTSMTTLIKETVLPPIRILYYSAVDSYLANQSPQTMRR